MARTLRGIVLILGLAAVTAACGGEDITPGGSPDADTGRSCSADNCDGCCTPEGSCVRNIWDRQCGVQGAACTDCTSSGDACNEETGECQAPPSCDASNCPDGCCDGDECIEPGDEVDACGTGGAQCEDCGESEICDGTQCKEPCGPGNCSGCCAEDGECVEEPEDPDAQCGLGGAACETCAEGSFCNGEGECVEDSCSNTCDGCCDAEGECIESPDQDNGQCGFNGAECTDCTASNEVCADPGVCVDAECSATCDGGCCGENGCNPDGNIDPDACGVDGSACIDCGDNSICDSGECRIDPDSTWDVVIETVDVPSVDQNNEAWDGNGSLPDPYVELTVGIGTDDEDSGSTSAGDDTSFVNYDSEVILEDVPARALLGDGQTLFKWTDSDVFFDQQMSLEKPGQFFDPAFGGDLVPITQTDFYDAVENPILEFATTVRLVPSDEGQAALTRSVHRVQDAPLCRPARTDMYTTAVE